MATMAMVMITTTTTMMIMTMTTMKIMTTTTMKITTTTTMIMMIMKAKKKPLDVLTPDELGVDMTPTVEVVKVEAPAERAAGIKVESVEQLVDKLKNEAKVIS